MNPHDENLKSSKRRSFFKAGLLLIGGLISAVTAIPLFGFAILPALKKSSKKYVVLGIVDLLKGSRYKKVNYTFQSKDGWVQTNRKTFRLRNRYGKRKLRRLFQSLLPPRLPRSMGGIETTIPLPVPRRRVRRRGERRGGTAAKSPGKVACQGRGWRPIC